MSKSVSDRPEAQALVARLARGIEHRINNLITVLMISSQQLEDMDDEEERDEIRLAIDQTVDKLALMQMVLTCRDDHTELGQLARGIASIVSGLNHRITLAVDAAGEARVAIATDNLSRVLIAAALAAVAALPDGGQIRLHVEREGDIARVALSASSPKGRVLQIEELDAQGKADLRLFTELVAAAGPSADVHSSAKELRFSLEMPGL
jgi:hypothetical protein